MRRQLCQQAGHQQRLLVAVGLVLLQRQQRRREVIHLFRLGRDGVQPLLQQADAGGEILGGKLAGQRLEGVLEVVEEPRVVGPHAG